MRLSLSLRGLLLVSMLGWAAGTAEAQWVPASRDSVARLLAERIEHGIVSGMVLGMVENGRPRVQAMGPLGGGRSAPLDASSVMEIGSVSKVFTTILLAEMVSRGEVALEDPISRYLPAEVRAPSRNGREITLLDLATSTSGLPRMPSNFAPADHSNPYVDYGTTQLYAFLQSHQLARDPGASFEYSNLGMGLLGHLLSLRAGMPYEQLVIQRILSPLGMTDTRISLTPSMQARLAAGHDGDLQPRRNWDMDVLAGAGAWRSTASDMLRFLAAVITPPPGALGDAIRMSIVPRRPAGGPGMQIGLGWIVIDRGGRTTIWHNGQTAGYHSFIGFDPASGANAMVLTNTAANIDDVGFHLINPAAPLSPIRSGISVSLEVLERYVGRYQLAPTFAIEITRTGAALYARATDQPRFRLFAATPQRFFLRVVEAEIEFTTGESGEVTGLVLHQGGRATPGQRVP